MISALHPNVQMLMRVADRLGPLLPKVAFVGGATVALYITRPGLVPIRPTRDVDVIVEVASRVKYDAFATQLRKLGFREDPESPVLCRWLIEEFIVDVMPTDTSILGFSNRWYPLALETAARLAASPQSPRLATAPCFIATKIEAFLGRGEGDFLLSSDLDDILTIVLGRAELPDEIAGAPADLRDYLAQQFATWLQNRDFRDAIAGHLLPDATSQAHFALIVERLSRIAALTSISASHSDMS